MVRTNLVRIQFDSNLSHISKRNSICLPSQLDSRIKLGVSGNLEKRELSFQQKLELDSAPDAPLPRLIQQVKGPDECETKIKLSRGF